MQENNEGAIRFSLSHFSAFYFSAISAFQRREGDFLYKNVDPDDAMQVEVV